MKLVGGDSGRMEHEEFVPEVQLAPSERAVVDVLLQQTGQLTLEHRTPSRTYPLASITVTEEPAAPSLQQEFEVLRRAPELAPSGSSWAPGWPHDRTRSWPWWPRWATLADRRQAGRWRTAARCIPRLSATSRAVAPSVG
jgi:hypothetical protein